MKALTAGVFILALSAVAFAKTNPVERLPLALLKANYNGGSRTTHEDIGALGAMRERAYFEAPQPSYNAGAFPCRLESVVFHTTRLPDLCR